MTSFSRFPRMRLMAGGVVLALAGSFGLVAMARDGGPMPPHGEAGLMGSPFLGHRLDHLLTAVKATDAQRAQIKQIAQAAAADLKAQHEAGRKLHEQGIALFTQPTVDPAAAEALRQQLLVQHDQASKRVLQAMLDISKVLTPEQRQQLAEQLKKRHEMFQRHHRERAEPDRAQP
jgi:Spy/CpxP family protein refolding chaperone